MIAIRAVVTMAVTVAAVCVPADCLAQTAAASTQRFEVASVKLNTRPDGPRDLLVDPGRFTATGVLLVDLIRYAYAFNSPASQSQVTGTASWISTTRFDIVATAKGQPTLGFWRHLRFARPTRMSCREQFVNNCLPNTR